MSEAITFNEMCGQNIVLTENNTVATWDPRTSGSWAYSETELLPGQMVEVKVDGNGRCDIGFVKECPINHPSATFRTLNVIRVHRRTCNIPVTYNETGEEMKYIATREREEAMWNLNALPKGTIVPATARQCIHTFCKVFSSFNEKTFKKEIEKGTRIWILIWIKYGEMNVELLPNGSSDNLQKFVSTNCGPNISLHNDNTRVESVIKNPASICLIAKKIYVGSTISFDCSSIKEGDREPSSFGLKLQVCVLDPDAIRKDFNHLFDASVSKFNDPPIITVETIEKGECNGSITVTISNYNTIVYRTASGKQTIQCLNCSAQDGIWIILDLYRVSVRSTVHTGDQGNAVPGSRVTLQGGTGTVIAVQPGITNEDSVPITTDDRVLDRLTSLEHQVKEITIQKRETDPLPVPHPGTSPACNGKEFSPPNGATGDKMNIVKHYAYLVQEMETMTFCDHLYSNEIITQEQMDIIHAIYKTNGSAAANRELLKVMRTKHIEKSNMERILLEARQQHLLEKFYPKED